MASLALSLACVLLAAYARADGADEDEARAAMQRGVAAFGRGDALSALAEYETAQRRAPDANAPYLYAAEALSVLGRYEDVVVNLERYLAKNPEVSDADAVRRRIARVKAEHYSGRVHITSNDAGASVVLDGEGRGAVRSLEMKPGKHRVELRSSDGAVAHEVDVIGDQDTTLMFTLPEKSERPPLEPTPRSKRAASPLRTVAWVATGTGAATLLATFVVDVAALGPKLRDYRAAADRADPAARDLRGEALQLKTLSIIGYIAGGAITSAGVALLVFGPPRRSVAIAPWAAPTSGGLDIRSTF